jgi:putative selenium metabolism protein SsnA
VAGAGSLLIENGTVLTLGESSRVLPGHDLACRDGLIAAVAPHGTLGVNFDRVIDATGKVVLPGFINAHMHLYSTLARGLGKARPSADFTQVLENLWWRLDRALDLEDCYYSALVVLLEAVKHGTTTLFDHHASPSAVEGSLAALARAVRETGVRASLCYEISDRDGPEVARAGIGENVAFLTRCRAEGDNRLGAMVGLHASFTLSDATLEASAAAGRELGAGFHVHVAEAASDQEHCRREFGLRVVERLERFGLLGPRSIAAHCVHVSGREMELLAETGTAVAHNPQSNMNNAVGVADVPGMARKGVLVGLGTDAMTVNMLEEVRAALWVRHLAEKNPSVGFAETLSTLLVNNARIANRHFPVRIGELRKGCAADLVLVDYEPPTPLDEGTLLGHLTFGIPQSTVDTTVVGGRVLMTGKKLELDLDETEVAAKARERARALWGRF